MTDKAKDAVNNLKDKIKKPSDDKEEKDPTPTANTFDFGAAVALHIDDNEVKARIGDGTSGADVEAVRDALTERDRVHLVYETRVVLHGAPDALPAGMPARVVFSLEEESP